MSEIVNCGGCGQVWHDGHRCPPVAFACSKSLVYLATPYSHDDHTVMHRRFEVVNGVAARLMKEGIHIYSPISHTHPIAVAGELPRGWDFWEKYDRAILAACCKVIVVRQDGWEQSRGVTAELAIAEELGLPVEFIDP